MCTHHVLVLVLLAQLFTIELNTSDQEIDCNNCFGKNIHFLALCVLVSLHCQILALYLYRLIAIGSLPLGERWPAYNHIVSMCMCTKWINTITMYHHLA